MGSQRHPNCSLRATPPPRGAPLFSGLQLLCKEGRKLCRQVSLSPLPTDPHTLGPSWRSPPSQQAHQPISQMNTLRFRGPEPLG